jgi:hypothetical protein
LKKNLKTEMNLEQLTGNISAKSNQHYQVKAKLILDDGTELNVTIE